MVWEGCLEHGYSEGFILPGGCSERGCSGHGHSGCDFSGQSHSWNRHFKGGQSGPR